MTIQTVLFDLDGTLLDTANDLGQALNRILREEKLPELTEDIVRPAAGQGAKGLIKLGLNIDESHEQYSEYCQKLLTYYADYVCHSTQLFVGMESVLTFLEKNKIQWGIVTNKPARFTDPLVAHLKLNAQCVISGDTLAHRKPHPEPLLHACQLLQTKPEQCLYVGDSRIDIVASKAAGMRSLAALYGYIPEGEQPLLWNADGYVNTPDEIITWLQETS